jgi:hypothetical protein
MNELEIVKVLFDEWRHSNAVLAATFEYELDPLFDRRQYPTREQTIQCNESDAGFVRRLLKRRGIAWYVRPGSSRLSVDPNQENGPAHTLVLFNDCMRTLRQNAACAITARTPGAPTYHTTPVRATSAGALELLPNHRYPSPWLHANVLHPSYPKASVAERPLECLHLPNERQPNPYDLYRDMQSWYRLVDPALADPAGKYQGKKGGVETAIIKAIDTAERFHSLFLGDYYHPNTHAFYGADRDHPSFGQVSWIGVKESGLSTVLTPASVAGARPSVSYKEGGRLVDVDPECSVLFKPAPGDARGDGTVPQQSGAGPVGKVKQVFETQGYDHQGSYNNDDMLMLTLRLIAKIAQGSS